MKYRFRIAVLTLCAFLMYAAPKPVKSNAPRSPDVFLVTIDTLRADHVACYGDNQIETPALDSLARDGVRFAHAFTASTITNTAHASILTGVYPSETGVLDFGSPLRPGRLTMAEALRQHGYATAAFIAAIILDSNSLAPGMDRGFDFYDNFPKDLPKTASGNGQDERRRAMDVVQRAEKWLQAHPRSAQPRFVWVHLYDPHDPYDPPAPFNQKYRDRPYDGEIAYADSALNQFLGYLKLHQDYAPALILLTGDHGEGLGDHGEMTHGLFLYDSTTHVPMLAKLPGNSFHGTVVEDQVRTVDLLPTLLDLVGIHSQASFDGASLRPLWEAVSEPHPPPQPQRVSIAETDYPLRFGWAPLKSVRAWEQKYIEAPRPEFYQLRDDPKEERNVYQPWNADVQRLRGLLADFRARVASQGPTVGSVSPQQVEELKAIGYWGNDRGSTTAPEPTLLPDPKDKVQVQNALHLAMIAEESGKTDQARTAYLQALNLDPKSPVALSQMGELELKQHDYAAAADLLGRARAIRPDASTALEEGRARYQLKDLTGARDALEAAVQSSSGQFDARLLLGQVYAGLGQWNKAEDQLEAAVFLDGKQPSARIELGRVLLEEHQPQQALDQLREAEKLDPGSPEARQFINQALRELGNTQ